MRIEAYTQVAQLYKTNNTSKAQSATNVAAARDEVQLSSFGRDYQIAKKAVAEASDIREDKVAEMKSKLASDNYQVDTGDFASKLLEKYNAAIL
ncbi:MAG: flagellar biosynthesis anti-sigma factor FlgM [Lachnospiraceae bacterium]|jgi:negative regulator of flagellin synthesis FlgM|nr:flagellar biosynthesis anti-sigma factor FlgM [Lachnospiraceae bacterium]